MKTIEESVKEIEFELRHLGKWYSVENLGNQIELLPKIAKSCFAGPALDIISEFCKKNDLEYMIVNINDLKCVIYHHLWSGNAQVNPARPEEVVSETA